jgi:TPR repeat protein
MNNGGDKCPFCREPIADDGEEWEKRMIKRVKANDPTAMCKMGTRLFHYEGEYEGALEYWTKAAKFGDIDAHYQLGNMYWRWDVVERDEEKALYHFEKAAIGGHPDARYNLGLIEKENYNMERAVKHHIIAAKLGDEESMKVLWKHYSAGNITKEGLEATLRAHKAAIDEMKSPEREAAAAWRKGSAPLG